MGLINDSAAVFKARRCLPFRRSERAIEKSRRSGRCDAITKRIYTVLITLPTTEAPGHPTPGQPLLLPKGTGSMPNLRSSGSGEVANNGDGAAACEGRLVNA